MYAFGLEEHVYNGSGSNVSNTYYYTLGGRLIGKFDGTNTQYYLTDAQGSVLTTFSNAATTTSVSGYQAYGPYGNKLASSGSMSTAKGFTGQYQDPTGLDYYNARYYDPVIGCFTSADTAQGNAQGMDPYSYVNGNPETLTDPTGQTVSHCHEPGDCGPDSGWVDPPASSSSNSDSSNLGSVSWGDPGTCDASCQGVYRPQPQLNSSRPTSGGNPKIVTSTAGSSGSASGDSSRKKNKPVCLGICGTITDPASFWGGIAEAGSAFVIMLGINALTDTVAGSLFKFVTASAVRIGIQLARSYIMDGLNRILASFTGVSPLLKLLIDIMKTVADVLTIVNSITDIADLATQGPGLTKMGKIGNFFGNVGKVFAHNSLDFAITGSRIFSSFIDGIGLISGGVNLGGDIQNLQSDWKTVTSG